MPTISRFYGIVIRMWPKEPLHHVPHVHVFYGGNKCSIEIETGKIISGLISNRALTLALEWLSLHKKELLEMWNTKQYSKIPGLE